MRPCSCILSRGSSWLTRTEKVSQIETSNSRFTLLTELVHERDINVSLYIAVGYNRSKQNTVVGYLMVHSVFRLCRESIE
jgi:hypothetical protein